MPGQRPRMKLIRIAEPAGTLDDQLARWIASPDPAYSTITELEAAVEVALRDEAAGRPPGDRARALTELQMQREIGRRREMLAALPESRLERAYRALNTPTAAVIFTLLCLACLVTLAIANPQ